MAADYQTGISSSPTNLLQTLVSFLSAQGWTTDSSVADGTGWRAHLHKSGLYVNLRAAMNELIWPENGSYHDGLKGSTGGYGIGLYLGDGYSGAAAWHEQSGRPVRPTDGSTAGCGANLPSGSVAAYHIFDDGADHFVRYILVGPQKKSEMNHIDRRQHPGKRFCGLYCSNSCFRGNRGHPLHGRVIRCQIQENNAAVDRSINFVHDPRTNGGDTRVDFTF